MEVRPRSTKVPTKEGSRVVDDGESNVFLGESEVGINGINGSRCCVDPSILTNQFEIGKNRSKVDALEIS